MNRDKVTLLQIADAAQLIVAFSQDFEIGQFAEHLLTRSAVLYQFAVLGEAVKRLSEEFRENHPSIPWNEIAGMRDRVVHGYDSVNFDRVWDAIVNDIPDLLIYLQPHLPRQE
ncbi:MAG: DUF86 domain-containing protein [Chloroflexi bacterium]|nr:DUF86 domain-containing protein [Chloroflexota bacterium]